MPAVETAPLRIRLLSWYDRNQRQLPWRKTRSAYRIWISEVMLQQTRVAAVIGRYRQFLRRFPTIRDLAAAHEAEVLAAWSGLGYYRRARSAHKTARLVVREHGGRFPREREELRRLPGVGDYTSAAIASIAFGKPHAVVDGNVERVLQRLVGRKLKHADCAIKAQAFLSPFRPGDFNQAMMELGATVCTPEPKCSACPIARDCATRGKLPQTRTASPVKKIGARYALAEKDARIYLVRRAKKASVMPGMWELPPDRRPASPQAMTFRHSIMNTNYVVQVSRRAEPPQGSEGRWIPRTRLHALPLTGLARKVLSHARLL